MVETSEQWSLAGSLAGTQHDPSGERTIGGVPTGGAGTLALVGDLKSMNADYLRGVSITGYGASLAVGVGVPIPVLEEEIARQTAVSDKEILAPVVDYSHDYWNNSGEPIASVTYEELRSGHIEIVGKKIKTAALSSYVRARQIASTLKNWIEAGTFTLGEPVESLTDAESGRSTRLLAKRKPGPGTSGTTRECGGL